MSIDHSPLFCVGCTDNFYNGNNGFGISECWRLKSARKVTRWKLEWWTSPMKPGAFVQVDTYSCHHEPGRFAFLESLPSHAVDSVPLGGTRRGVKQAVRQELDEF
jgi:hypothetical protein